MAFSKTMALVQVAPPRIPPPSHRHAAPSGPWPWIDLESEDESDAETVTPVRATAPAVTTRQSQTSPKCVHIDGKCDCWVLYPQSLFPNWTPRQVKRSKMKENCASSKKCDIHYIDIGNDAQFSAIEDKTVCEDGIEDFWKIMSRTHRLDNTRVRALFVENLSVPVMQMLGTKYNVEPFYFSSSLNWIPSRYQEEVRPGQGDHITITLTFLRSVKVRTASSAKLLPVVFDEVIDTQLPLPLPNSDSLRKYDQFLHLDLLAIHMVRRTDSSTIISFHPTPDRRTIISSDYSSEKRTPAQRLHSRVYLAGQSVYWQNIFQESKDPTFVLLAILWYALYAWDEGLEMLWEHICQLESSVINTNDIVFTRELHKIRAHLLHYASLLRDFRKSVKFVLETPNPAMDNAPERDSSRELLKKECNNLTMEIERLEMSREMADKRLKNVMNLAFSTVNIEDSRHMQRLTEAAVRDSAAMKQISYLTMVFLPASFAAALFGMNIQEVNPGSYGTLAHYAETAISFTAVTVWIIVASQGKWRRKEGHETTMWYRLWWPAMLISDFINNFRQKEVSGKRNVGKLKSFGEAV